MVLSVLYSAVCCVDLYLNLLNIYALLNNFIMARSLSHVYVAVEMRSHVYQVCMKRDASYAAN